MRHAAIVWLVLLFAYTVCTAESMDLKTVLPNRFSGDGHQAWEVEKFPNPQSDTELCGRGMPSWICDPDGLMTRESADVTEGLIKFILSGQSPYATIECGDAGHVGYEVAVAIVKEIAVDVMQDPAAATEQFAHHLQAKWGVGRAACQNGVLILIAIANRQMYVSVGEGAKARLSWEQLGRIIEQAKVFFRSGQFGMAVEHTVTSVGLALAGAHMEPAPHGGWGGFFMVAGVFGGLAALAVYSHRHGIRERLRYRDCRVLLERIKRDQAALQSGAYSASSCPICLEEFVHESDGPAAADPPLGSSAGATAAASTSASEAAPLLQRQASPAASASALDGAAGGHGALLSAAAAAALRRAGSPAPLSAGGAGGSASSAAAGAGGSGAGAEAHVHRRALVVPCGHVFCEPCLTRWMAQQSKLSCPICRSDLETGDSLPPPPQPGPNPNPNPGAQLPCHEQLNAWDRTFPDAVLPGIMPAAPRLRLDPHPWFRSRADQRWRFRGASGYTTQDWSHHYNGNIAHEQIMEMQRMELLFRIQALRRRYPEFITPGMARNWSNDLYLGRELSAQVMHEFQLLDPVVRAELRQAGSSGNYTSFGGGGGGGRSSGGRGSSW